MAVEAAAAAAARGPGVCTGRPGWSLGRALPHRCSGKSAERRAGSLSDPSLAQPCRGLEREAPARRKGRGASLEDTGCLSSATMKVKVIPVLEDNYMYLVIEERTREAVAVDVAVPKRVRATCGRRGALGPPPPRPAPCSLRTWRARLAAYLGAAASDLCPLPGARGRSPPGSPHRTPPASPLAPRRGAGRGGHLAFPNLPNSRAFQLLEIVGREGVSLTTVLTTHHHW